MNTGTGNTGQYIPKLEHKYNLTAIEGELKGISYLIDDERDKAVILLPSGRLKNIGRKSVPCPALFLTEEEFITFAGEIQRIYREWFIELKGYKRVEIEPTAEGADGKRQTRKKRRAESQ